jgi:hypothetical protein
VQHVALQHPSASVKHSRDLVNKAAKTWELIAELKKMENYKVLFGKPEKKEVSGYCIQVVAGVNMSCRNTCIRYALIIL